MTVLGLQLDRKCSIWRIKNHGEARNGCAEAFAGQGRWVQSIGGGGENHLKGWSLSPLMGKPSETRDGAA